MIRNKFEKSKKLDAEEMSALLKPLGNCARLLVPETAKNLLSSCMETAFKYLENLGEDELKSKDINFISDLCGSLKTLCCHFWPQQVGNCDKYRFNIMAQIRKKEKTSSPESETILQSSNVITIVQKQSFMSEYAQSRRTWTNKERLQSSSRSVKTQTTEEDATKQPKQYSNEVLAYATQILYSSRRAYKFLRRKRLLKLPHPSTIYRHLSSFICLPGINDQLLRLVSLKISTFEEEDRICSLSVDEIHLQGNKWSWSAQQKTLYSPKKVS